jgi:short-chain fatty acids transporter
MKFIKHYINWFKKFLPSPFSIAVLITIVVFFMGLISSDKSMVELIIDWQKGLWSSNLLAFAFQMMLMLVLGHALALTSFFDSIINQIILRLKTGTQAAFAVTLSTIIVALFNWGLGLIFGAIIARKVGENFTKRKLKLNYPLIGASGYVGLMVWHGGISGSALTKVAESGHIREITQNPIMPELISFGETVFSPMNFTAVILLIIVIPAFSSIISKYTTKETPNVTKLEQTHTNQFEISGAEYIDYSKWLSKIIGMILMAIAIYIAIISKSKLGFINPNYINFSLLGLNILLHKNIRHFLSGVDKAIHGSSGILIQFPLYFGILALMQTSGLIENISDFFIDISNKKTLPIYTFFSAGLVNMFVPSGGGQWALQGPIILRAALELDMSLSKIILALAYGDQITNMLQPFWALPLLSITGLKAKDILPYTLMLMVMGTVIFLLVLMLF